MYGCLSGCDRRRAGRMAAVLLFTLLTAACAPNGERAASGIIQPSYVFPLGANQNDVLGLLGQPQLGPKFDRYSNLTEVVYRYPFPAIKAETRFPNGTTRVELVDTIHMFFNQKNVLERMASQTNRFYSSFTDMPVHRITVLPRLVDSNGGVSPVPNLPPPGRPG